MAKPKRAIRKIRGGPEVIKETAPGGMRKIRCPNCKGMAIPTTLHDGTPATVCQTCGAKFTMKKF
jgi:DNA-directed RNA polymerase subunit RPC12/RpoP